MGSRLQLQAELQTILGSDHVYFQPPESVSLKYPAIVYKKQAGDIKHADNNPYFYKTRYQIIVIDYDPDANWTTRMLAKFPSIRPEREYVSKNLNHWPFSLYY